MSTPPSRLTELWDWFCALDAYDYADRTPLAELIAASSIPNEFKPAISAIVAGERTPNLKAAAKLKVPAAERMRIALAVATVIDVIGACKEPENAELASDKLKLELIKIRRELESEQRKVIRDSANQLTVSTETIENIVRDLREKINKWPVV